MVQNNQPRPTEIIFELFQPMWSRYLKLKVTETDKQTTIVAWFK